MSRHLPTAIDVATRACAGCHGRCCEHTVPLNGYDLLRLARGLGLPWDAIADLDEDRHPFYRGFRLDRGPVHRRFRMRQREGGACQMLLELDGGHRRCGVHALRPGACRIYPLTADAEEEAGVRVAGHVVCPDERAAIYRAAARELRHLVDDDLAEEVLYWHAVARWDELARCVPVEQPLSVGTYLAWLGALYDAVAPLRAEAGRPRGAWQEEALRMADAFPLP